MQVDIYRYGEITTFRPNVLLSEKYRLQKTSLLYVYVSVCLSSYKNLEGFTLQC